VLDPSVGLDYTTVLNLVFLVVAAALVWRFLRTGGPAMLRMMGQPMPAMGEMAPVVDPVCGMTINPMDAAGKSEYQGQPYYFCSTADKQAFDRDPGRYVSASAAQGQGAGHGHA